jgi:hypothetical protein
MSHTLRHFLSSMLGVCATMTISVLALATPVVAQQSDVGVLVGLDGEGTFAAQALPPTDFTVQPSVTSSTLGAAVRTLPLRIFCVDLFTGQIINNCNVTLTHQARASSGGHNHTNGTRPKGTFQPSSGSTGTNGLPTTYTAHEISGIVDTTITGTAPNGTPVLPGTFTIGVQIPGLVALPSGTDYDFTGITGTHPDSHYATPAMNGALAGLATAYATAFPGSRLPINDMSLTAGGLFDYQATWLKPHASHRFGNDADLDLVPVAQRRRLRQLITAAGLRIIPEGVVTHWHVRQ